MRNLATLRAELRALDGAICAGVTYAPAIRAAVERRFYGENAPIPYTLTNPPGRRERAPINNATGREILQSGLDALLPQAGE